MVRILLIDDHEILRNGLKQLLAANLPNAEFGEASNAKQARVLFSQSEWNLVLLDISLPAGSGLDLLAEFKQQSPQTPVLVLSAYSEEDYALRALKLGANGYLTKASVSDEMLTAVRKALAGEMYVSVALVEMLATSQNGFLKQHKYEALSRREMEVLRLLASGKTIKEIALHLSLSEKTIATYRSRIAEKLGLSTNVELARYALKHGLVN